MRDTDALVISLGGSIIVPHDLNVDIKFLSKFKALLESRMAQYQKIVIVTGGGAPTRLYQQAAKKLGTPTKNDLDWLGIHMTRQNARLIRLVFKKWAHKEIITDFKPFKTNAKVVIAAGTSPGWSTDYVCTRLASNFGVSTIVNLSDIPYVYDKDPGKHRNAQPVPNMSWKDFRKLVGNTWTPGLSMPFDPIASKEAQKQDIDVYVMNGNTLSNFERFLDGKDFIGTRISNG